MKLGCSINLLIPGSTEIEVKVVETEFESAQPIGIEKVSDTCTEERFPSALGPGVEVKVRTPGVPLGPRG